MRVPYGVRFGTAFGNSGPWCSAPIRRAWQKLGVLAYVALCLGQDAIADADHYQRCAACHLADGMGVPGMFPPLAGHVKRFFGSPDGRSYLSRLVSSGANGAVEIRGERYAGMMPSVVADLSNAEVADLLNGLVQRFGSSGSTAERLFSPEDVARARAAGTLSATERASLRQRALVARAPQDWMLHCQGCHGADGTLSTPGMPALRGQVARYLGVPGGRARLVQVPGVANASLSDARMAATLNWMLVTFDGEHLPDDFDAFTGEEVGALRRRPPAGRPAHALREPRQRGVATHPEE